MAHNGSNGSRSGKREGEVESRKRAPDSAWVWRMIGLTRDRTAKPNSRDQILRRERGQGKFRFPCSPAHKQDCRLIPNLLKVMEHTNTHVVSSNILNHKTYSRFVQLSTKINAALNIIYVDVQISTEIVPLQVDWRIIRTVKRASIANTHSKTTPIDSLLHKPNI